MSVIDKIRAKAVADVKHVVLAEGSEPRTVQAAEKIVKLGLAKITLVGAKAEIEAKAAELGVDLTGVSIADPATRVIVRFHQGFAVNARGLSDSSSSPSIAQ